MKISTNSSRKALICVAFAYINVCDIVEHSYNEYQIIGAQEKGIYRKVKVVNLGLLAPDTCK